MEIISIILAAGKGSRMKSSLPKPLHQVTGKTLINWLLDSLKDLKSKNIFVLGEKASELKDYLGEVETVIQKQQLGTGHAVKATKENIKNLDSIVLVAYADTPFVNSQTLEKLIKNIETGSKISILGFNTNNPSGYGRIITDEMSKVIEIIEERDANKENKRISLCNSGILAAKADDLFNYLEKIKITKNGEYYLTDIVKICKNMGHEISMVLGESDELLGINNKLDLTKAEKIKQDYMRKNALINGITLKDPNSVYFNYDTVIEEDVIIEQNVVFGPQVTIRKGSTIRSFSYLEECTIGQGCVIGPYARIRPKTILSENVKIGNFVEIKKSEIGKNSKINHLSYVGDTVIGENSNIGAGTITCNYDGASKHKTIIGDNSFIGSNTSLVAPLLIGNNATIGAGSTITKDVNNNSLAVERSIQKEIKNFKSKKKKPI